MEFALGPYDPLRHRRLGYHEGLGDLTGLEAAEKPQDERDLGVGAQVGVGAQEHEPELIVGDDIDEVVEFRIVVRVHGVDVEPMGIASPLAAGGFAPEAVDGPVAGGRGDPAARVGWDPRPGPLVGGNGECFRHRVLGEVDVAQDADEGGGAASDFAAEDLIEGAGHPWAGRTSTGPSQAAAAFPAHSRAASRSVTSIIQKPPICSLVSA